MLVSILQSIWGLKEFHEGLEIELAVSLPGPDPEIPGQWSSNNFKNNRSAEINTSCCTTPCHNKR